MSEERTQSPSRRRRQQARERGLVARSPELTAAIGLSAAVVLLGVWGGDLTTALVAMVRDSLLAPPYDSVDVGSVTAHLQHLALVVAIPLGAVLGGVLVALVAAHQVQVGGLWVPGLVAPDPARLWGGGVGAGLGSRFARGGWLLAKSVIVVAVAAWVIRSHLPTFDRLSHLEVPTLARASGNLLQSLAYMLALATLALGLADFALQYRRLEAMLHQTSQEQREDQRAEDGDPALRARRRQLAQAWHVDPAEMLPGASLVLMGSGGLTVVLAGGPPPSRILVRGVAKGATGLRLRQAADRARLPQVNAQELAHRLSQRPTPGMPLPAQAVEELTALWPAVRPAKHGHR
ncbi:MAG TPA: EscU/YscU/HrcU family type III secretion system export apparatus switch protein [Isosphaeraceae bacterium]|jgi:flagellar biosynthetic protein FlhB|nr:EscU/YscU/HrcU family type III secretion system export apparatus switch protein [Isosphaeraceae bacterium]